LFFPWFLYFKELVFDTKNIVFEMEKVKNFFLFFKEKSSLNWRIGYF